MKLIISFQGKKTEYTPRPDLGVITIGRVEGNDVVLPDEKGASRRHATIERTVDGWKLVDQMSSNGTLLNGEKLNFGFLKEGDKIRIGRTKILVTGIAPSAGVATAQPLRRVTPAERGRPMGYVPPRKSPAGAIVVVGLVVVILGSAGFFVYSHGRGGVDPLDEQIAVDRRHAELSSEERDAIAYAESISSSRDDVLTRIKRLDVLSDQLKSKRASVALSRASELKSALIKQLDSEVKDRISETTARVEAELGLGSYVGAIAALDELDAWLDSDAYIRGMGGAHRRRIATTKESAIASNTAFITACDNQIWRFVTEYRYGDAIDVAEDVLARAWLAGGEREVFEARLERLRADRESYVEETSVPTVEVKARPSVLDRVKDSKSRIPGSNPLFPEGRASEAALIDTLRGRMIEAAVARQLTSDSFSWRGDRARILGATQERLSLDVMTRDRTTNEELSFRTSARWDQLRPEDLLQLFDRVPSLTPENLLATAVFAFDAGMIDEGATRALRVWKLRDDWKDGLDTLVATKRRIAIPEEGFVEHDGMLVTPAEKEDAEFRSHLRVVLERFERGINSRDKRRQEDAEAAFSELLELGDRAVQPSIELLNTILAEEVKKAEAAAGLAAADGGKMDGLLAELDRRREHALELIFDEARYPYPPGPNQAEVQADVDARVAAVREIWDDPTGYLGQTSSNIEEIIEDVRAISQRMDKLDPAFTYHTQTSDETIDYLRGQANERLTIRTWPGSRHKYLKLINYNRAVMAYNENFPTGDGHTNADGRAQVKITNEYRIMFARHALKLNDKLFWGAWHHSKYCVEHNGGQIAHVIPGEPRGASPAERMAYEGYTGPGGENIHMNSGGPTPRSAHDAWCTSSGHHRNILNARWRVLGSGKFRTIWTQKFGAIDEGDGNSESRGGE